MAQPSARNAWGQKRIRLNVSPLWEGDPRDRYDVRQVGGRTILEYWIPAEDLEEFNDNIVGTIEVIAE